MTDFVLGSCRARVNPERTRAYYDAHPWEMCDCAGCRNFVKAAANLPQAVADVFRALGLDPLKPAEACHYYAPTPDSVFSSAWYHVHGEFVGGEPEPGCLPRELTDGVSVSCKADCDLLPDDFPRPCFQVEFWFDRLPWVLGEPNPY